MDTEQLEQTARALVTRGKGLLAADETNANCKKRFEACNIRCTEETRRQFREILITAPHIETGLHGVALREEGFFQSAEDGQVFRAHLKNKGVLLGIAVDKGIVDLPGFPEEKITQGLDGLPQRLHAFAAAGARFAKWRFQIAVGGHGSLVPTDEAIGANTLSAARFARMCQDAGIVPVVEVELLGGTYDAARAEQVLARSFDILFATMRAFRVHLSATLLGANIVADAAHMLSADEAADRTCRVLYEHVPHDVAGVLLLDTAAPSSAAAVAPLSKIIQRGPHPWGITFSYAHVLQDATACVWAADRRHEQHAQATFIQKLDLAGAASRGEIDETLLTEEDVTSFGRHTSEEDQMKQTLEQMRANCAQARAAMERARTEGFAFGAFNLDDEATLKAVVLAAKAKNAPVLVEVSQGEVDDIGIQTVRDMVDNFKADYGVEMYINLDHSPSVEAAKKAIDAGYEFIHIDVSQANHDASDEEIVAATREVVEYAKKTGALVESEPHYFGGSSNLHTEAIDYDEIKKTFSTPEGARAFIDATGIDTFAAAIGNLHGKYPVPKELDLELLQRIRDAIPGNISLHGGSGTPGEYFEGAVKIGVTKININSDMRIAYREALEKALAENPNEYSTSKLVGKYVVPAVQAIVESKIDMFNSAGKAQP